MKNCPQFEWTIQHSNESTIILQWNVRFISHFAQPNYVLTWNKLSKQSKIKRRKIEINSSLDTRYVIRFSCAIAIMFYWINNRLVLIFSMFLVCFGSASAQCTHSDRDQLIIWMYYIHEAHRSTRIANVQKGRH